MCYKLFVQHSTEYRSTVWFPHYFYIAACTISSILIVSWGSDEVAGGSRVTFFRTCSTVLWEGHVLIMKLPRLRHQDCCFKASIHNSTQTRYTRSLSLTGLLGYALQTVGTSLCGALHAGSTSRRLARTRIGSSFGQTVPSVSSVSWIWRDIRYFIMILSLFICHCNMDCHQFIYGTCYLFIFFKVQPV